MAQLDFYENPPLNHAMSSNGLLSNQIGRLRIWYNYIPGDISFNKVHMIFNGRATNATTRGVTFSLGIFSLNGSTLSLANSASFSSNFSSTNTMALYSFVTSATQNISQGEWWFGIMSSTSGGGSSAGYGVMINQPNQTNNTATVAMGGPFFRGQMSVTTAAMPASLATSALSKEIAGSGSQATYPYIIISA